MVWWIGWLVGRWVGGCVLGRMLGRTSVELMFGGVRRREERNGGVNGVGLCRYVSLG